MTDPKMVTRKLDDMTTAELRARASLIAAVIRTAQIKGEHWERLLPMQDMINGMLLKRTRKGNGRPPLEKARRSG